VRYQQKLAHTALRLGRPGAARVALQWLRPSDFLHPFEAGEHLAVLRNLRASDEELETAAIGLILQPPARH
jgi:hypothetical protein